MNRITNLNPSLLNFLAGLAAATAVNLVTSIVGADGSFHNTARLLVVASPWLVVGLYLWRAATLLEQAHREIDRATTPVLRVEELDEISKVAYGRIRPSALRAILMAGVSIVAAVLLTVFLFGIHGQPSGIPASASPSAVQNVLPQPLPPQAKCDNDVIGSSSKGTAKKAP